jgi:hypothetical protein
MYRAGLEGMFARGDYNKFSTIKHEGYTTFAENVATRHPGFEVSRNDGLFYVPGTNPESIEELKSRLLRSPIQASIPQKHFISKCRERVAYTSYSRSGNTFLRSYFERLTDVFTGSDGDLNYALH